jgi:hypothetical protein
MLLFKTILLIILLVCLALCAAVFIYNAAQRLSSFWRNTVLVAFFLHTCHNFGVGWTKILLLYISVCVVAFILRALFPFAKTKRGYSIPIERNNFSYNSFTSYSNYLFHNQAVEEEQPVEYFKFNKFVLCALLPLWLIHFLSKKTINNSFSIGSSFYSSAFSLGNKIIMIFKNIKAA